MNMREAFEKWKGKIMNWDTVPADIVRRGMEQLAASQAREKKLREAFRTIAEDAVECDHNGWPRQSPRAYARAQLALPTDDTALQARLKEERERCAVECEQHGPTIGRIFASKIRSMK